VNSSRREDGVIELGTEFRVVAEHLEREATRWHEFARHNRATACGSGPRSRERDCFLVVQTLWAEKIQSTTDAGSLNTFGRNDIEVAPISSALLRIACLVILYKLAVFRTKNSQPMGCQDRYEDSRSTT
jgi:hypothetical protein